VLSNKTAEIAELDFRQKSNMALASVTAPFWCLPDYVFLKKT